MTIYDTIRKTQYYVFGISEHGIMLQAYSTKETFAQYFFKKVYLINLTRTNFNMSYNPLETGILMTNFDHDSHTTISNEELTTRGMLQN